jgi:hypothetical protein
VIPPANAGNTYEEYAMKAQSRNAACAGRRRGAIPGASALTVLLALASPALNAQTGVQSFDCQVETEIGVDGLVMVQAGDADTARRVALGGLAITTDNRESRAVSVKQCVLRGEKRFIDLSFRRFAESLPR